MTGYRDLSATFRTIKAFRYRDASNTLCTAKTIRFRDASNTLRTLYGIGGFTAVSDPNYVAGYGSSAGSIRVSTGVAAAQPSGGSGSYSYAWSFPGGSSWTVVSPTSQSTQFRSPLIANGGQSFATATCVVTDTVTGSTISVTVNCEAYNEGP